MVVGSYRLNCAHTSINFLDIIHCVCRGHMGTVWMVYNGLYHHCRTWIGRSGKWCFDSRWWFLPGPTTQPAGDTTLGYPLCQATYKVFYSQPMNWTFLGGLRVSLHRPWFQMSLPTSARFQFGSPAELSGHRQEQSGEMGHWAPQLLEQEPSPIEWDPLIKRPCLYSERTAAIRGKVLFTSVMIPCTSPKIHATWVQLLEWGCW